MDAKTLFYQSMYVLGSLIEDQGMSILCYHSIDDSGSRISLSPERFAAHMRLLHELGYRTIHISDVLTHLLHGIPFKRKVVAITFDDGFENLYSCAMPIMRRYGHTGTVFVIGEMVGKTTRWRDAEGWLPQLPLMDWQQIRELHRLGFQVGAHSLSHHYLTALDDQQLCDEVKGAKLFLEDELAAEVAIFAYPYGDYDERVIDELIRAGYRGACATIPTRLRMTERLFALPRLFIARDTSPAILRALLSPGAAVGFRVLSALRRRSPGDKPWYVPDPACTDSTGTVAPIPSI